MIHNETLSHIKMMIRKKYVIYYALFELTESPFLYILSGD